MYMRDLGASLVRRWYLALAVIAATVAASFGALSLVPPSYQGNASVVLVPPESSDDPAANRYLSLGGLSHAADVLVRSLSSDATHKAVEERAPNGAFEVATDWTTSAPILLITVEADTARNAEDLVAAVQDRVQVNLGELQTALSIDRKAQITSVVLTQDDEPDVVQKRRMRLVAALAAGCMIGGALAIGAMDGLLLRRARRRQESGAGPDHEHPRDGVDGLEPVDVVPGYVSAVGHDAASSSPQTQARTQPQIRSKPKPKAKSRPQARSRSRS